MQKLGPFILFFGTFGISLCSNHDYNFEFERFEPIKGDKETLVDYSRVRLTRKGSSGTYLLNGNVIFTEDLGSDVMHRIKSSYSADGSSHFRVHPYTVEKSSACKFFKTIFREYGQPRIEGHSNFTIIPEEGICPVPKGIFYLKDVQLSDINEKLPDHAPRGLWKYEQIFEKNGKVVGGLTVYGRITDKV